MIDDHDDEGPEALVVRDAEHAWALPLFALDPARPVVTIGRSPRSDLVLPSDTVSRHHARLERRGDAWWVVDLGSVHGTRVDGERVQTARLRRGASLRFGDADVAFGSAWYCRRLTESRHVPRPIDGLTGACSKWTLPGQIEPELEKARATGAPLAVAFFDVDSLARVNETFGHPTGDAVLREIAARVRARMRAGDILGRYAGDELVLVLPGVDLGQAVALAGAIRADIASSPVVPGGAVVAVTVSVGVVLADPGERDPMAAVLRARERAEGASSG